MESIFSTRKWILVYMFLLLASCTKNKEEAQGLLDQATTAYRKNELATSKQMLDSLKRTYPGQLEVLKNGLQLMRQVELSEQERNLRYCDSLLIIRRSEADSLKRLFVFEKDAQYDDVGKYIDQQQVLEQNFKRSYIRSGINELGEMYISSVYYGSRPVQHDQLKVVSADGEFAETAVIQHDGGVNFSFKDLGMTTEIVTYQKGKDNGVVAFTCDKKSNSLKAELYCKGTKMSSFQISNGDKKSLCKVFNLYLVLSDLEQWGKVKEKAISRITYLKSKIE